jgi:Uncharacterized ATPase, putative transposase
MKNVFVETENVTTFKAGLDKLDRRVAKEKNLIVIDGEPGLGKTTTLSWWVAQTDTVYLRACKEWTPRWFLEDLLNALGVRPRNSFHDRYQQGVEALLDRQSLLAMKRRTFAVVIDEADHISNNSRIMETARDFSDNADIPFIFVGMGKIRANLTKFPQIWSRVAAYIRFEKASKEDVIRFCKELCEVPVADDLAGFLHQASDGFAREILDGIFRIETFGERAGNGDGNPVTLRQMAGEALLTNRKGALIKVPEGL